MRRKDIESILEIIEFYLDYCTPTEDHTDKYARKIYDDLWKKIHVKVKKRARKRQF